MAPANTWVCERLQAPCRTSTGVAQQMGSARDRERLTSRGQGGGDPGDPVRAPLILRADAGVLSGPCGIVLASPTVASVGLGPG